MAIYNIYDDDDEDICISGVKNTVARLFSIVVDDAKSGDFDWIEEDDGVDEVGDALD